MARKDAETHNKWLIQHARDIRPDQLGASKLNFLHSEMPGVSGTLVPPDHLYVLQSASGHIKIGRARDVRSRIEDHRVSNPFEIVCVAVVRDKGCIEREVLRAVRMWRVRGEWVHDTRLCRNEIERLLGNRIQWRFRLKTYDAIGHKEDAAILADERLLDRVLGTAPGEDREPPDDTPRSGWRIETEPAPLCR